MNYNLAFPMYEHARANAGRLALSVAHRELSYGELSGLAGRVAAWLTARPRQRGFVGVLASRSLEAYAGVLGACWAGDAYVPLNPKLPEERLAQLLSIIRPAAVIADEAGTAALSPRVVEACGAPILKSLDDLPQENLNSPCQVDAEDTAYMIFTSGSTGIPKGVMVPARAVYHLTNMLKDLYGFGPHDRFSKAYNLSFDGSVHDLFTCWNAGASLHVVPANQLMAPARFIQEHELTMWTSVPSTAVFLERMKLLQPGAFPSLKYTIFSGEPLPLRSALAWKKAAPNSVLDNSCGHTEFCVLSTFERMGDPPRITRNLGLVAIGKALPGLQAAVWDEQLRPVPPGVEGELVLSGPQCAKGYFNDAERTAARFPRAGGQTWYRTGDLVVADPDGCLHHLGRIDAQVKILGHRVELGEVEAHLSEICGSDSVAAVAWPVDHGSARGLVAFHCNERLTAQEIRDALARRLPRYMVPHQVRHVAEIPLTSNGKIDRRNLTAMLEKDQEVTV
jgi:amino acid adenylation domain-containing protein